MADSKQTKLRKAEKLTKDASALDKVASQLLSAVDRTYAERKLLDKHDAKIQAIIDRPLDTIKGVSSAQMVDILATVRDNNKRKNNAGTSNEKQEVDTNDLFTDNVGDIFGYFQDIYKNRYLEVSDLKFISKFIPVMGEAVRIYLDSIISSDDISQTITRNLTFPGNVDKAEESEILSLVNQLEDEHEILLKLKIAYKKTMIAGTSYLYHIPYKDLFATYSQGVASGKIERPDMTPQNGRISSAYYGGPSGNNSRKPNSSSGKSNFLNMAQESHTIMATAIDVPFWENPSDIQALENFGADIRDIASQGQILKCSYVTALEGQLADIRGFQPKQVDGVDEDPTMFIKALEEELPNVYFMNSNIPSDVISEVYCVAQEGYENFFNDTKSFKDVSKDMMAKIDTAGDITANVKGKKAEDFDGTTGTYLKWIDFKYMIPIEVLNKIVGYYHIVSTHKSRKRPTKSKGGGEVGSVLSSASMNVFDKMDVSSRRKEEAIQGIVDTISEAILDQFSAKYVRKNPSMRQMIADCLIANGLVDNDYMIQFIPAENVIIFKVNEDDEGKGVSILADAIFPSHMLLSMVVSKMLNYINKGGNKTIAHISNGKVAKNMTNQVNRVIRDLQSANVTFTDLLSSNAVFSKVTRDSNIAMPKDASGNKLVEFEIQEGQNIDLNTDYENMLNQWCLIGIGLPTSTMEQTADIQVAKKVVSDNIRVAGRTASLQADLETPSTQLYRVLLNDSGMEDVLKSKAMGIQFKLPRPRILVNQNNSEALNTAFSNAQMFANIMVGEDASEESDMLLKRKIIEYAVKRDTPFIEWKEYEDIFIRAKGEIEHIALKSKVDGKSNDEDMDDGMGGGGMDDMGGDDMGMGGPDMGGDDMGGADMGGAPDEGGAEPQEGQTNPMDTAEGAPVEPGEDNGQGIDLQGLTFDD